MHKKSITNTETIHSATLREDKESRSLTLKLKED
jgi:hypothetical protein